MSRCALSHCRLINRFSVADEKNAAQKLLYNTVNKKRLERSKVEADAETDLTSVRGQMDVKEQEAQNAERKAVALAASSVRTGGSVLEAEGSVREASVSTRAAAKIHGTAIKRMEVAKEEVVTAESKLTAAQKYAAQVNACSCHCTAVLLMVGCRWRQLTRPSTQKPKLKQQKRSPM